MGIVINVKIASADRNPLHLDEDIIIPLNLRFRDVPDFDQSFPFSVFHNSFHSINLLFQFAPGTRRA